MKQNKQWYRICLSTKLQPTAQCVHTQKWCVNRATHQPRYEWMSAFCPQVYLTWFQFKWGCDQHTRITEAQQSTMVLLWGTVGKQLEGLSAGLGVWCLSTLWTLWLVELQWVAGLQWHCGPKGAQSAVCCWSQSLSDFISLIITLMGFKSLLKLWKIEWANYFLS